jgi:hypothetical protein
MLQRPHHVHQPCRPEFGQRVKRMGRCLRPYCSCSLDSD